MIVFISPLRRRRLAAYRLGACGRCRHPPPRGPAERVYVTDRGYALRGDVDVLGPATACRWRLGAGWSEIELDAVSASAALAAATRHVPELLDGRTVAVVALDAPADWTPGETRASLRILGGTVQVVTAA